ncbi:MAG: MGH1-like glycoside hydrolase domain-containing protein [Syntrophothermus sp.]
MKKLFYILAISSVAVSSGFAQYEDTGKRGLYYSKKTYTDSGIPLYSENKSRLPVPVMEQNKEWIDIYWKAWELAFNHYKKPPAGSPFVSNFIDEAFSFSVFQWDTIFMIMFARYADHIFPAIQSLDNFYCRQYESGYICREIQEPDGADYVYLDRMHTVNPPLFGWAEIENFMLTGDKSRFAAVLPVLEKYTQWLEKYRVKAGTKHGLYWQTGLGSGMDNTPRKGSAWTDMSAQMVLMYNNMNFIAGAIGNNQKAAEFKNKAKKIADKINKLMWNEADGLYYDLDDDGNQIRCKTAACFWPLLAGIASGRQAERMLANLKDPKTFWRTIPFPSLAADHPDFKPGGDYWLGSVWAPTNVMIIKGLTQYSNIKGFSDFATEAVSKYLEGMYQVYKETGTLWENYSSETYSRGSQSKPDFVGWTGCGPIELLIENILGFAPDRLHNKIKWTISRTDRHGIENLTFGDNNISAVCAARKDNSSPAEITVDCKKPFTLEISTSFNKSKKFNIKTGQHTITVN